MPDDAAARSYLDPVPDPSSLTTQQLLRQTAAVQELLEAKINSLGLVLDEKLKIHNEKFQAVQKQFAERDTRGEQSVVSSEKALAAALQAAKELVGVQSAASASAATKSEASFTKQIDQIGVIIKTLEKALDQRITELKERIDRGDGQSAGAMTSRTETRLDTGMVVGVISVILVVVGIAVSVIISTRH